MKKKLLTITASMKGKQIHVREHSRPHGMSMELYDASLLAVTTGFVAGKLKAMPITPDQAGELLEKLIDSMRKDFDRVFGQKMNSNE